ncbi:MAG: ABC transporter permease [Actinomycetota bacterium]|nr:ABC transporter permease [Actinomycetota bacterium]
MTSSPDGGRSRFPSLRLAARLARREVVRRPWRTLLVASLVAVPVAAMTAGVVTLRTGERTWADVWRTEQGHADAVVQVADDTEADVVRQALPEGSEAQVHHESWDRVLRAGDGRIARATVTDVAIAEPMAAPIAQVLDGRAPTGPDEVFVTRRVADDLDVGVGDRLDIDLPVPASWTVVGTGERAAWWGQSMIVLGPGTEFAWRDLGDEVETPVRVRVALPDDLTRAEAAELSRLPYGVEWAPGVVPPGPEPVNGEPADVGHPTGPPHVAVGWVGGAVALTVLGIVIAAAFAAGARRQLVVLGQLSANGAMPSTLRRVLLLQGTWTGAVGVLAGFGLGAIALFILIPHVDAFFGRDVAPYTVRPGDLAPIAVIGVVASTLAAAVPAWSNDRLPVLTALAGRRPLRPVPRWLTPTRIAVLAAGLALLGIAALGAQGTAGGSQVWIATGIAGGVAVLFGACAVAPGYVSVLGPIADHTGGSRRLAARSLARQRTRTSAVVSAVGAAGALAVAASALVLADLAGEVPVGPLLAPTDVLLHSSSVDGGQVRVPDDAITAVQTAIGGESEVLTVRHVSAPGGLRGDWWRTGMSAGGLASSDQESAQLVASQLTVVDATLHQAFDPGSAVLDALGTEGVVLLSDGPAGEATVEFRRYDPDGVEVMVGPLEATVIPRPPAAPLGVAGVLVSEDRAAELGLVDASTSVIVRATEPLTAEQRSDVLARFGFGEVHEATDDTVFTSPVMHDPADSPDPFVVESLLTAGALTLSLFVVAANLALAAAETRDERDVLLVVGAAPRAMRRASGYKALLLTALGTLLAVPVGLLPATVIAATIEDLPLVVPWRVIGLLLVAVPLAAATIATGASGLALRLRPVTISTMAHE